jgi:PHD/YefM family antitoxin component YafN of YafNO toxin-antitoxin module
MTATPINMDYCRFGSSSGANFVFGPFYVAVRADLVVFGVQSMTQPARVAITDPVGVGDVIYVTQEKYDSIDETASILGDAAMMAALKQSEAEAASGLGEPWESVKAELGL